MGVRFDPALALLLLLIVGVAAANVYLVITGLIPPHLGAMTVIAGLVAIGLAVLQARG